MNQSEAQNSTPSPPFYRADFHMHTRFSPDSFMSPQALVRAAHQADINCVAVTDHNTVRGALAVQEIAPFRVIIGEEIRAAEGEIIGLFLTQEVPGGLSARETVRRIKDQGGLVQVPHPFDRLRRSHIRHDTLLEILPDVDIIEAFNARTTLRRDILAASRFIQKQGASYDILPTSVTDSHTPYELGRAWVEMPSFTGAEDFLNALHHGRLQGRLVTPLIHLLTRFTKLTKPWLR